VKIQALAVAAASLAVAVPALPAQASELRTAINQAARAHCNALSRGATWTQAITNSARNTEYGRRWYARASDDQRSWLSGQYQAAVGAYCQNAEQVAYSAHKRGETGGSRYTGGNTNISEDPFEF
tara:strand:+ start:333 stop:707 length:375 start_codon:yes stop_codon:yes gene_type:complete